MNIKDIISETTAGGIAGIAHSLGGGDPEASIYPVKKKRAKSAMIRRVPKENKNESK